MLSVLKLVYILLILYSQMMVT